MTNILVREYEDIRPGNTAMYCPEANKLVRQGLLVRQSAAHDRRVSELKVTEDCARRLAAVAPIRRTANETIFGRLTPEEVEGFTASLGALMCGLEEALHVLDRPGEGPR